MVDAEYVLLRVAQCLTRDNLPQDVRNLLQKTVLNLYERLDLVQQVTRNETFYLRS
jgi:hypothetical protein